MQVYEPYFTEAELYEVQKVLDSKWVAGAGPATQELEKLIMELTGAKYAVSMNSCTAALHLAVEAFDIGAEDDVLVADYTFPATAHAVMYAGARPVFVDVDKYTFNIDIDDAEAKLTDDTKAIIPVHTFGNPAEMDDVMEFASKHKLRVIEDAACALGATYRGRQVGTIGDIGCYSFHARKGVTTGEGGMAITDNKEYADRMRFLSRFGFDSAWERTQDEKDNKLTVPVFMELGYNYKMSDINAAVGIAQMKKYPELLRYKARLAEYYSERLDVLPYSIELPYIESHATSSWQSYVISLDPEYDRDKIMQGMLNEGIQTRIGTYSCSMQPVYGAPMNCPVSEKVFNSTLTLPLYHRMTLEDISRVVRVLEKQLELQHGRICA